LSQNRAIEALILKLANLFLIDRMTNNLYINFSSLLTILLALVMLYYNYRRTISAIYFFFFLLLNSLWTLSYGLLAFGGSPKLMSLLIGNIAPFFFLIPPLLYFILRSLLYGHQPFHAKQLLHLLPFVIHTINLMPYLLSSNEYKLAVAEQIVGNILAFRDIDLHLFYPHTINVIARNLQHLGYVVAGMLLLRRYRSDLRLSTPQPSAQLKMLSRWIYAFYSIYSFVVLARLLTISGILELHPLFNFSDSLRIYINLSSIALLLVPLVLILFPRLIFEFSPLVPDVHNKKITNHNSFSTVSPSPSNVCEQAQTIGESVAFVVAIEEHHQIYEKITTYLAQRQPYLESDFRLQDLALGINIPVHKVRATLKAIRGLSFSDFKNENRIEYACLLLQRDSHNKTIEAIALGSGFASVSNFYEVFKAVKGISPSVWIMQNVNPVLRSQ